MNRRWLLAGLTGTVITGSVPSFADDMAVLQVSNGDETAVVTYTMDDLMKMPSAAFQTSTVWTDGVQEFVGVSLHHLVNLHGVQTGVIEAFAVNEYMVEIPVTDAVEGGPIIAYIRNGDTMSLRDKGPLWIVYPYDDEPDYQREEIFARSIWQLNRISLKP